MCVCVCVCVYVFLCLCECTCLYACVSVSVCACVCVRVRASVCVRMYVCECVCLLGKIDAKRKPSVSPGSQRTLKVEKKRYFIQLEMSLNKAYYCCSARAVRNGAQR